MDITDKENFQKQMDFLKRHNFTNMFINFDGYLCLYQYLFLILFLSIFWLIIVKGILMGILISEYYVMYRFFKPIALDENKISLVFSYSLTFYI